MPESSSCAESANPSARGCPPALTLLPSPRALLPRGPDRRRQPTPRLSRHSWHGGRRGRIRRADEREGSFVDLYGRGICAAVLWVAMMNVGDSFFTLVHLQAGGVELNPVAIALLGAGRTGFVLAKSLLIGLALAVLAVHKNFFLARVGLWTAAGMYTLLLAYHLTLFQVE
ncbi:MAG: DUF5658 family protein [Planctomycetota bacterium]